MCSGPWERHGAEGGLRNPQSPAYTPQLPQGHPSLLSPTLLLSCTRCSGIRHKGRTSPSFPGKETTQSISDSGKTTRGPLSSWESWRSAQTLPRGPGQLNPKILLAAWALPGSQHRRVAPVTHLSPQWSQVSRAPGAGRTGRGAAGLSWRRRRGVAAWKNRQDVTDPQPGTTGWGTVEMPWGAGDSTVGESREIRSRGMGACRWRPGGTSKTSLTTSTAPWQKPPDVPGKGTQRGREGTQGQGKNPGRAMRAPSRAGRSSPASPTSPKTPIHASLTWGKVNFRSAAS